MPYEGEYANYSSIHRLAKSERVNQLLGSYKVCISEDKSYSFETLTPVQIKSGNWTPNFLIAIDGSHLEVPIKNGFPGAEASYVTIACVILDVHKMKELDKQRPANPKEFRETEKAQSIDCALPGCNLIKEGEISAEASLRRTIYEVFDSVRAFEDGESLLDTYQALLSHKPPTDQKCPYEDCLDPEREYQRGKGKYVCRCSLSRSLYSTDALRIHERMNPAGTNGAIFAEIMQVLERVWLVHILRNLEKKQWLSSLGRLAIIIDGPLAVFGQPAWISQAIYRELSRINTATKQVTEGKDILLIGSEKTGLFVEHFNNIDRNDNGSSEKFPPQTVGLLTDSYIKRNIIFSESTRTYGDATYFGRKLFYKTKSGARLVVTLPFLRADHRDLTRAEISQFPRLADAVGLLDELFSSRYPNAISPLVSANSEAAIPLNLGKKILEELAKQLTVEN